MPNTSTILEQAFKMCNGIEYTRHIPLEAELFAKQNRLVIIVGGGDDLMYAYGADSWLADHREHGYGWDGDTLTNIGDKQLQNEAEQLGLKIFWRGQILDRNENVIEHIEGYDIQKLGAFSYTVKNGIEFKNFTVVEDLGEDDVYCTGIIIKLPDDFVSAKDLQP